MRFFPVIAALVLCGLWAAPAPAVDCSNNIPPSNPDAVYVVHVDGTVTDTRTGIMWKQCVEGLSGTDCTQGSATQMSWAEALTHAEGHSFAGFSDWRLPNITELHSLVEECRFSPAINTEIFPSTPSSYVWSGSPYVDSSGGAWGVDFYYGYASGRGRGYDVGVRLARGGQ